MSQSSWLFGNKVSLPQPYNTAGRVGYYTLDTFDAVCPPGVVSLPKCFIEVDLGMLSFFALKSHFGA